MNHRSLAGRFAFAAALVLVATATQAQNLRVDVNPASGQASVLNQSARPLGNVSLHAGADWQINCGGGFGLSSRLGDLAVNGRLACEADSSRARSSAAIMASGVEGNGRARLGHASRTLLLDPGEGIIVLAGGAVHNDTNGNGVLNTAETLDYHYTLLNLGDLDLSGLAVVDQSGAVSCPQTTLAVGANMVCTRSYVLTATDESAGGVVNIIDVDGVDSAARPVGATDVIVNQNLQGRAGVRVFKSPRILDDVDNNNVTSIGDIIEYTFVIKNSAAEVLNSVNLFEPDPSRIDTPIVCSATTLSGAPFSGNGTGSLTSNEVLLCTAQYTVRASDAAIRQVLNVAEVNAQAPVAGTLIATAASTVVVPVPPVIGVAKGLVSNVGIGPGPYAIRYSIVVENFGTVDLQRVQVIEDLRTTFPLPVGFDVVSVGVTGTGTPNPSFDGETDTNLLDADQSSLVVGDSFTIDLRISVSPGELAGPFMNQVTAIGNDSINQSVADVSVNGLNPDPDDNGDPEENTPTPVIFNVLVAPLNIPVDSPWALLALMAMLLSLSASALRRRS